MKGLFYGVAVSALVLGAGGAALACDQHAKSAALQNPAAATHAFTAHGFVLAQAQQEEQSGTTGEDSKESKPEASKPDESKAMPSKAIGPLAQSQDDADKEKAEEGQTSKPEAAPSRGYQQLAQAQQEEQSGTTGEDSKESKPDDEQK